MDRRKQSSSWKRPNVDIISTLPDSILCHILSFLPTEVSAKTSILARRWRFLWADVPNIDLDFYSYGKWNKERRQTSDVINRIFLGHNLKALNTFRLVHTVSKSKDDLTRHQLETWIAAVIARGKVRNIELHFGYCIKLPECLFTYKSLVDLRLYNCEIRIPMPASISFPSLEKLHLCYVKYNNDETFQHLISGCSILEELIVIQPYDCDIGYCRISSPTLKWLTIKILCHAQDMRVEIIAPALRSLRATNYSTKYILAEALWSLTEADIVFNKLKEGDIVYSRSVLEFQYRISNVKCLKLQISYNEYLHSVFSVLSPSFYNLTKLELAAADWRLILKFLEVAENVQVLIIDGVAEDLKSWVEPKQVCTCLISHLKSIVIQYFRCKEYEYTMVRYLLKNAKVLASMKILCRVYEQKEKFDALQRISLFERGSEACKLDFR